MKILVIGAGGREHAIVDSVSKSSRVSKIYVAPGNGGMRDQAEQVSIPVGDLKASAEFAEKTGIELTVVGPEIPLSMGIVNLFRERELPIIGPTEETARLESSKAYTKHLCSENAIPTAAYVECETAEEAYRALEEGGYPIVIKADGLAAGKGVVVAENREEARQAVRDFMELNTLGGAGKRLVIEEFLVGEEASFHVFADGTNFAPMVAAQDHKARFDGDQGPNTGGMGAYSVDTVLTEQQRLDVMAKIIRPTLDAISEYSGILYAGLMLTDEGPKLLEYNVRFGDPETQVLLPRLRTDLVEVFSAILSHSLDDIELKWSEGATASVVLVAEAYPGKVKSGKEISGLDVAQAVPGVKVYHAGTIWDDGRLYTAGGRVLNVTATSATLSEALEKAYFVAEMINFEGKDYRRDIGQKGLRKTK